MGRETLGKDSKFMGKEMPQNRSKLKKTQVDLLDKTTKQAIHSLFFML